MGLCNSKEKVHNEIEIIRKQNSEHKAIIAMTLSELNDLQEKISEIEEGYATHCTTREYNTVAIEENEKRIKFVETLNYGKICKN